MPFLTMINGTPDEVKIFCEGLIDVVGKGAGFIVNGDIGISDEVIK